MGLISRDEFLKRQAERESYQNNGPRVGYFGIKEDKGEAIVRFCYKSPDEFEIVASHKVNIDGKYRNINCIRSFKDPVNKCPLCAAGERVSQRFFIRLLEYTRDENNNIVVTPKIWERPTSFITTLSDMFTEYGMLDGCVFKVKRNGKPGDMQTTYSLIFPNQTVYNAELYPYAGTEFEGYNVIGHAVVDKTFDELTEMVAGKTQNTEDNAIQPPPTRKVTY